MLGRNIARKARAADETGNRGNVDDRAASVAALIGVAGRQRPSPTDCSTPCYNSAHSPAQELLVLHGLELLTDAEKDAALVDADDLVPRLGLERGAVSERAGDACAVDGIVEAAKLGRDR
jgi:hypothetical protein